MQISPPVWSRTFNLLCSDGIPAQVRFETIGGEIRLVHIAGAYLLKPLEGLTEGFTDGHAMVPLAERLVGALLSR